MHQIVSFYIKEKTIVVTLDFYELMPLWSCYRRETLTFQNSYNFFIGNIQTLQKLLFIF
jgi:hypothetical protein